MALELAGWTENSTYIQYAASKSDMFFSFRSTNFLNAERLTRKRLWASWKWFRSLSTQDDQHRQEVPGEAKGDQFSLELKLASRWLHSSSLTLRKRSLYSLPVLRGQARCIHSGLFDCECVCLLLPNLPMAPASSPWKARTTPIFFFSPTHLPTSPERYGCPGLALCKQILLSLLLLGRCFWQQAHRGHIYRCKKVPWCSKQTTPRDWPSMVYQENMEKSLFLVPSPRSATYTPKHLGHSRDVWAVS